MKNLPPLITQPQQTQRRSLANIGTMMPSREAAPSSTSHSNNHQMLRVRDVVAAAILLWLFATAWDEATGGVADDTVEASIRLSFFIPQYRDALSTAVPQVFDVDGDGTPEALVAWTANMAAVVGDSPSKQQEPEPAEATLWTLQMHDLRPALANDGRGGGGGGKPFQPKLLLQGASSASCLQEYRHSILSSGPSHFHLDTRSTKRE
jgi:hypothetical protein